jgi:hypothetical protein
MHKEYKYDVAISFAEEDRDAALALSFAMKLAGFSKVYYYPDKRNVTWGQHLPQKLTRIYSDEARYAVMLLSNNYFDPQKIYTHLELAAIRSRAQRQPNLIYMLPVKLNDKVDLKAYPDFDQIEHVNWEHDREEIVELLKKHLGSRVTKKITRLNIGNKVIAIKNSYVKNANIITINNPSHGRPRTR